MCKLSRKLNISIAWSNLPIYAAASINEAITALDQNLYSIKIISNNPDLPITGVEKLLESKIYRINLKKVTTWKNLGLDIPDVFFHTGWNCKAFNSLAQSVRSNRGYVIGMIDNSWKNNYRQKLGKILFKAIIARKFNAIWVPGNSSLKLMNLFDYPQDKVYTGLYTASDKIFHNSLSLEKRNKSFIFIGRLIKRKGVDLLAKSFMLFKQMNPEWSLEIFGCGEMEKIFYGIPGVNVYSFQDSIILAEKLNNCRFLILPSREEHWGVVLHEATLSGCGIIASSNVGAAADLINIGDNSNGYIFETGSVESLYSTLVQASELNDSQLQLMNKASINSSQKFSTNRWSNTFRKIIHDVTSQN